MRRSNVRGVTRAVFCSLALATALMSGCGMLSAPAVPPETQAAASPTLLPPPKPMNSPEPVAARSIASPPALAAASPTPSAPPTRIPPPSLNPTAVPAGLGGERARVVKTDGQGANMRSEPSPTAALVRTIKEGTELEVIGAEREGGGRRWRNVSDVAGGATGWIVTDLLEPMAGAAPARAAEAKPAGEPKPEGEPKPAGSPPAAQAKPAGEPKPSASPAPPAGAPASSNAGVSLQRIGDADRAYLSVLQGEVDALGKSITAANEQIERVGGRAETLADPAWRQETQAVAKSLSGPAAKIRAASPGPATGEVHTFARNAADRADEAAAGLTAALESRDPRALNGVRTTLIRMLAEINNMNLTLLGLQ